MKEIIKEIKTKEIGRIEENIPLSKHTTYRVGGVARVIVYPKTVESLVELLKLLKLKSIKHMVLGKGSNVLFSDNLYDGVIIKLDEFDEITFNGTKVKAGAGVSLMRLAAMSIKKGLAGLEFASGIPGTLGGAVYMNAGAYKSDMGYIVESVLVITPDLKVITLTNAEMDFHYRTSFIQKNKGYICLEVRLKLEKGDKKLLEEITKDRRKRRVESQPLEYPSAGSVFRNPEGNFAGKLIEDLGMKGLKNGGAQISDKHANFVINKKHASSSDIHDLIMDAKTIVKKEYDIDLKVEQEFINWE